MKLRTGDRVKVIAGPAKGVIGTITSVFPDRNKVIVDARYDKRTTEYVFDEVTGEPRKDVITTPRMVGGVLRHLKPRQTAAGVDNGGITEVARPIHVSNVTLVDDNDKPVRVGSSTDADGKRTRIGRKAGKEIKL